MIALQKTLSVGLTLLAVALSGCACCPLKSSCCGDSVGCCDTPSGCDMAFQQYDGCCEGAGLPVCVCTGDCGCEASCGCDPGCGCEPSCGCEPGCGAEPGCALEPDCGCDSCSDACGCGDCCEVGCGCLYNIKYALGKLFGGLCGCNGCDGEVYWNEWHNDPPRCCDPCNKCGQWVGPADGAYRAPYQTSCGCN